MFWLQFWAGSLAWLIRIEAICMCSVWLGVSSVLSCMIQITVPLDVLEKFVKDPHTNIVFTRAVHPWGSCVVRVNFVVVGREIRLTLYNCGRFKNKKCWQYQNIRFLKELPKKFTEAKPTHVWWLYTQICVCIPNCRRLCEDIMYCNSRLVLCRYFHDSIFSKRPHWVTSQS